MAYVKKNRKTFRRNRKRITKAKTKMFKRRYNLRPQRLIRTGFPKQTMVKLKYVEGITLDPTVANVAVHTFRANSCFDPNLTGVGHQPMLFDMWSTLYNHYMVVGALCIARVQNNVAATNDGVIAGIFLDDDGTIPTNPEQLCEQGLIRYKMFNNHLGAGNGSGVTVKKGFSAKKFFNCANPTDMQNRIGAAVIANPSDIACFNVFVGPTPGSTIDLASHRVIVTIYYTVIFSEPKETVQS